MAGCAWVDAQDVLDQMFRGLEELLVDPIAAGETILDIGCGTGGTTVAAAKKARARALGIDISEPMIAAARLRAEREAAPAEFIVANAQHHAFPPAAFDRVISRFGVMFFDDSVAAFTNLRRAAKENAALDCIVWRSAAENPFMTTAERAAAPLLPNLPPRNPNAPGQFAFADAQRVRRILEDSGWTNITIEAIDVPCTFPASALPLYATRLGPVGMILQQLDDTTRAAVTEAVLRAFEKFVDRDEVRFNGACWRLRGTAGVLAG